MAKLRVCSLGSGSKGNATLVEYNETLLLVDSGFSCKELEQRLVSRSVSAKQVSAVLVTHEHSDHFNGVPAFANKYQLPVWMSPGTSLHPRAAKIKSLNLFNSHTEFILGDFKVMPVAVPHDSREACQFVFQANDKRVGILTDLGHITPYVQSCFASCDILLLEFNHDKKRLMQGRYPASLKARVSGSFGHLNNEQAAEFLRHIQLSKLQYLVAMHLSEENNCPDIVNKVVAELNLGDNTQFLLAEQPIGFDWLCI
ncbi:MBL fold metallo-hydrolase [Aliikangiella sp. IMCC44359]|uniref:MBL fold metallo-hydrolase n=1 Tax=Aliikangiella sp. IMCC44359 TaxID=3459125 RepID=UPI00403AA026